MRSPHPARTAFLKTDRTPTLWLPTHEACNSGETLGDEKIGQLIALRYGKVPADPAKRRLRVVRFSGGQGALTNLDVDAAVWRWVRGFHAALYQQPYVPDPETSFRAIATPFPRAPRTGSGEVRVEALRPQHARFVERIKLNRAFGNLDRIVSNNGKLTYECVWYQADNNGP